MEGGLKIIGCASPTSNNPDGRRPREKRQKGTKGRIRSNRCEKRAYPRDGGHTYFAFFCDGGQVGEKGEKFLLQFAKAKRKLELSVFFLPFFISLWIE